MGTGWQGLREGKLGFSSYGLLIGSLRENGMMGGRHMNTDQTHQEATAGRRLLEFQAAQVSLCLPLL